MLGKDRTLPTSFVLAIIGLGAFITALDQTVVVTALPSVMLDLKVPIAELDRVSWIITAYLLGYTVAMPLIGRLGDVYGYPRVYQASLVVFCVGTGLVALSSNLDWMIGARVIQAVGGGATVPIGMALATTLVPKGQRGLALGVVGASAEAGAMLGPAYGGAIVELLNWRWIFWLNIPQSAVIFAALLWLPNRRDVAAKVDYMGGVILVGALLVLSLALSRSGLFTFDSPYPFLLAAGGVGLVAVLVLVETRTFQPLLAPALFRSWAFLTSNLTQVLVGVVNHRHGDGAVDGQYSDGQITVHRSALAASINGNHPPWRGGRRPVGEPVGSQSIDGYGVGIDGHRHVFGQRLGTGRRRSRVDRSSADLRLRIWLSDRPHHCACLGFGR